MSGKRMITFAESAIGDLEGIRDWYVDQDVPQVGEWLLGGDTLEDMAMHITLGDDWWAALLGWPLVVVSIVAFSVAVARRSRLAAVAGCLLAAPMFAYLSLYPSVCWATVPAFLLLCVLAWRIRESGWIAVGALALPAVSVLVWLGFVVLSQ